MRGPRISRGAATAALLLTLVLLAPGGIAAAGAEAEVGAPSGRGPSDRAQAMDHAKAELVVARAELALARDALTAAEQAAAVAADPLPLQATIERSRAEVATLVGIVRSWQAALQSAIADVTSTPARGADGASGSGLHASGRAPKRALQTESDEEDGIDEEGASTAKGKRPVKLSDLPRTIQTPTLGFLDAEGKVHRKHALLAQELGVSLSLGWRAADDAQALLAECTRCIEGGETLNSHSVQRMTQEILTPVAELIRSFADRGQALHIEHKYGPIVAREYVGDDLPASPTEQRRLKRAQAAAREVSAVAARSATVSNRGAPARARQPTGSSGHGGYGGGGSRGNASGANAAPLGGGGRGRGRGSGGRSSGPTCYRCRGVGHLKADCPN